MSSSSLAETLTRLHQLTKKRIETYDTERAVERLQDAALRGAAAGLTVRGGLHLVSFVLSLVVRGKKQRQADRPDVRAMLKDTARWGAFLGSFSGLFVFWDELIAMLGGRKQTRAWRAMVSGTLAGPALLLTGDKQTHTSLALYVFIRGLTLLVRCGNLPDAHPLKRKLLAPTRWKHGDVALMCLSTIQIAYSWIVLPQTLPISYVRFLNKHGGKSLLKYDAIREMVQRSKDPSTPCNAAPLASLAGTSMAHFHGTVPCDFLHPGQSCMQHTVNFFPAAYLRALPVYFPVYVIPAILVHRKRLLQANKAAELWRKVGLGVLRSSLFLSLYCTLAWRGVCTGFNLFGRTTGTVIAASCWVAGLAALVEKRSRRMELALYCLSRAAESFALTVAAWGWVRPSALPRRIDVLLFSLASGFILHCYSDHYGQRRSAFRSPYLNLFDFILGNTGFGSAAICHHPSNADLLARLGNIPLSRSARSLASLASGAAAGGSGNGSSRGHSPLPGSTPGISPVLSPAHVSPRDSGTAEAEAQGQAVAGTAGAGAAQADAVVAAVQAGSSGEAGK